MAKLTKLVRAANATLLPGAVQNWADLDRPAAATPLLRSLAEQAVAGLGPGASVLIAGPHDPALVAAVAAAAPTTVVVRSIPDSAALGAAAPSARVLVGHLSDALAHAGRFDVVIALDDVTRLVSLEGPRRTWADLAGSLASALTPGGRLLLAVENELGAHRLLGADDPYALDGDGDWCPTWTWDATRPRTRAQVAALASGLGVNGPIAEAFGGWDALDVLARDLDAAPAPLLALLGTLGEPGHLTTALTHAGRLRDACAGWLLGAGGGPALTSTTADGRLAHWTPALGDAVTRTIDGRAETLPVDRAGSLASELLAATADADTPALRRLLSAWRGWLDAHTHDGRVDAEASDARFGTMLAEPLTALHPGLGTRPRDEVAWQALGDVLALIRTRGVRGPWPATLADVDVLLLLGAMAGEPAPDKPERFLVPVRDRAADRQELAARNRRLTEQVEALRARLTWDERRYAAWRAVNMVKRSAQVATMVAAKAPRAAWRLAGRGRPEQG